VDDEANPVVCIVSHVVNLRPRRRRPYDWAVDELSPLDVRLILAALAASDVQFVRDAGHRLDHHLRRTGTSPAGAGRQGVPGSPSRLQRPGVIDPDGGVA
jgi:hypothetical protein